MSLRIPKLDFNETRTISNESLNEYVKNRSFKIDLNYDTSLSDIYDTISLYDQNDESNNTKRLTWEEWYLKKKIQTLKNEKKMHNDMKKKMASNQKYHELTEEEKNKKLSEWIKSKRKQKKELEEKLKKVQEDNEKKKEKKEAEKKKADEKYLEWLNEVKRKEQEEKEKRLERERKEKEKEEEMKQKKLEIEQRLKEKRKEAVKVRPLNKRTGVAIVNGKLRGFFDWSTSPDPGYINKFEWKN